MLGQLQRAGAGGRVDVVEMHDAVGGGGWGPVTTSTLVGRGGTPRYVIGSVTMAEFSRTLGSVLNRPSWLSVPPSLLALTVGEMADMLLTGQRATPDAALKLGFKFKYPNLVDALSALRL